MFRSLAAAAVLLTTCAALTLAVGQSSPRDPAIPEKKAVVWPGMQAGGAVLLPNQWSIRPAGKQLVLGDFPVNLALHPGGRYLAVLHAGMGDHEVRIIDLKDARTLGSVVLPQVFLGLCFSPDGRQLYVSGGEFEVVHRFEFRDGFLLPMDRLKVVEAKEKFIPGGMCTDSAGKTLFVAGTWGHAVARIPLDGVGEIKLVDLGKECYPYTCLHDAVRERLYVSLWGAAEVAVVDLKKLEVAARWKTELHPTEMALSPDGSRLFVACANSTRVSVVDTEAGAARETIACSLYPTAPAGNTPSSLSLTPDGQLLFVANSDANNIAVFQVAEAWKSKPLGFIPVGWYPTSVRFSPAARKLYIANGKGASSFANPQGPNPNLRDPSPTMQYIARLLRGTLSIIDVPTAEKMPELTRSAYACSPLRENLGVTATRPDDSPIPGKPGDASPIKYCIYIIKENRTYDQVFGDIKEGNGDPNLCIFPEAITPNLHRLAKEFVLLDNFYVEGEVSADGHEWSMGAYCTDYVEKLWPLSYRGSPLKKLAAYPSEGANDRMARPAGGYIWDRCAEAGVSYRSYGEWIENGATPADPSKAKVKALEGHFDPGFRGYDLDYPDQKRADRFIEELQRFERDGGMPRFTVLRLPNDHTYGTRAGKPTPTAMVADNDLAVGRVIEALTNSKYWKETAVFVVEDDAQNGSDHVDAHRTVALVVSPYTRRGVVDSTMYSTSSMLRTMGLILGLKPMSQFDAAARPMYASFQAKPDTRPYEAVVPRTDLKATNVVGAWGQELSERFDLSREDAADDLLFNEVIWRSVKGPNSPMPAPVRAAFFLPHVEADEDDDD